MKEYRDGKSPIFEQPKHWRPLPGDDAMTRMREAETELDLPTDEQWALGNASAPVTALPPANNEFGHGPRHAKAPPVSLPASPLRGYVHLDYEQPQPKEKSDPQPTPPPSPGQQTFAAETTPATEVDGLPRDWFTSKVRPPTQT